MQANILISRTPSTPGVGSKDKKSFFFSESGHAVYQIKGDDAYNTMHASKYFVLLYTLDPWDGV